MNKFLLFCLAMAGLSFSGNAQDPVTFTVGGTTYEVTSPTTVSISDVDTEATEIIIPETVANEGSSYTVTAVGSNAFNYSSASKIVIPNTVTEIGYCGIYNTEATTIQLSANLKTLGQNALAYNRNVTSITIPEGVKEIPSSCFSNNQKMAEVILPSTIESIGSGSFYKVPIASFTFPENCTSTGNNIFQLAPNLTEVTFNANIETMGEGIFRQCAKLTKVNMDAATKLKGIPENCFVECNSLAEITIPASVETIGMNAFGKTAVSEYKVAEGNKAFIAKDGCVYAADMSIIWLYPCKKAGDSYTIPEGVRGIGGGAFYGAEVKTVSLPESMAAIDNYAFCESTLESINLPNSILQIGEQAFAGTNITELVLPERIIAIYDGLAAWCKQLKSVTIPADVRMVANHAFQLCQSLTSITCKGGVAPEILTYWDEEDNPFGYLDRSNVTLHIPSGSKASYEEKGWSDLFSNFAESEPSVFVPTASLPANGEALKEVGTIEITFPEAATIAVSNPQIMLRKGNELVGEIIEPDGGWIAVNNSSDGMTATVFPADYDGFTSPLPLDAGEKYFLIIPAGTFKNAAGGLNQKIVITYEGAVPPFAPLSFTPESNSKLGEINSIEVKFGEEATVTDRMPQITLKKDDASTGQTISPENGWIVENKSEDGLTVTITPVDYGYQPAPLALEPEATYYMTIPAGVFENEHGGTNEEIQLVYVGQDDGTVDSLEADKCMVYVSNGNINVSVQGLGTCEVAAYDLMGRCVAATATDNSTVLSVENSGMYIVKVVAEGKTLTFKVKK